MTDPIGKLQNDLRRVFARLESDSTVRFAGTIWHYLALYYFFEHLYTSEQLPFNQFEFHAEKAVSRPDTAADQGLSRGSERRGQRAARR
jgi:hypothetical protein